MSSTGPRSFGRLRGLARRMIVGGCLLLLMGLALSAAASPLPYGSGPARSAGSASTTLNVSATDAPAFVPHTLNAIAGTTVTFVVRNSGNFTHTFSLYGLANRTLPPSWTPQELDKAFAQNGSSVNLSLAPGANANLSFPIPARWASGSFEFVSLVP
jgi:plastocyanin